MKHPEVQDVIERWRIEYKLSPAETDILRLAVEGTSREELAKVRGVTQGTLKKQVNWICHKTMRKSLLAITAEVIRETVEVVALRSQAATTTPVVEPKPLTVPPNLLKAWLVYYDDLGVIRWERLGEETLQRLRESETEVCNMHPGRSVA